MSSKHLAAAAAATVQYGFSSRRYGCTLQAAGKAWDQLGVQVESRGAGTARGACVAVRLSSQALDGRRALQLALLAVLLREARKEGGSRRKEKRGQAAVVAAAARVRRWGRSAGKGSSGELRTRQGVAGSGEKEGAQCWPLCKHALHAEKLHHDPADALREGSQD